MRFTHGASPTYWLAIAAVAAAALWALYKFAASIRRDRIVADTPLVRIRSAAQGYVKVFGHAKPADDQDVRAPLSARPCVWWTYQVEEKTTNSKGETRWRKIDSASSVTPFLLADGDGECLVGPINAEVTPTTRTVWYGEFAQPKGFASSSLGLLGTGNYRYTESLLGVGDKLSVMGELRSFSDLGGTPDSVATLLREWKGDQAALLARFDANHDGHIDAVEWEDARTAAVTEAQSRASTAPITRTSVIGQPIHGEPFLIAAMDSARLARREKLRALLYLGIGAASSGICAFGIQHGLR